MWDLDPEYVEEMSQEGYDPHMKLLVIAGEITEEDYEFYVKAKVEGDIDEDKFDRLDKLRKKAKVTNYSALYGVGAAKLSRESGMSRSESSALLKAFWDLNWSIPKVSESQYKKEVGNEVWVKNPISGFYYNLRFDKDTWSTINQGTGVYIFDSWLARCRSRGYKGHWQFHDETGGYIKDRGATTKLMKDAVDQLNEDLDLNVTIGIDLKYGNNYAETH